MTRLERALWVLTVIGFVVPNVFTVAFLVEHGLDPSGYLGAWFASLPAAQIATDLIIAFVAFATWAVVDNRRAGVRAWWVSVPASLLVGLCFAIPLHFLLRERRRAAAAKAAAPAAG